MVLAKPTSLVILPVTAILIAVKLIARRPLLVRWGHSVSTITRRRSQGLIFAGLIVIHALAGWSAVWLHYGARYHASPDPEERSLIIYRHAEPDHMPAPLAGLLKWVEDTRILPEGYRRGIEHLLGNDDEIGSFMNGRWSIGGQPFFFPYAIWAKTQPVPFVLIALTVGAWWWKRRRSSSVLRNVSRALYTLAPYLVLAGCYLAIAVTEDLNIGHRHILPIYPCLYLCAGVAGWAWRKHAPWQKCAVSVALGWLVYDSVSLRPHYLAYFGPQAGGPEHGFRHLVDSSLDWGMNLPTLRRWLDQNNPSGREPLFLAYFGTDSPRYHGIESRRLPGFFDRRELEPYALTPGYYAISATLLQSVYTMASGSWSRAYENRYQIALHNMMILERTGTDAARKSELIPPGFWEREFEIYDHLRFARLCAWLRHQGDPPHHVGHAILIWKLTAEDLHAALIGPPAELTNEPLPSRQFRRFQVLRD